jgi:hypothetical protein
LSPFPSAESVRNTISELKKENLVLTENKGKLETELKVLQNTLIQKDQKVRTHSHNNLLCIRDTHEYTLTSLFVCS